MLETMYVIYCLLLFRVLGVQNHLETERLERVAQTGVEFTHELHPMQTQRVQESGQTLHKYENRDRERRPDGEHDENVHGPHVRGAHLESLREYHAP